MFETGILVAVYNTIVMCFHLLRAPSSIVGKFITTFLLRLLCHAMSGLN